MMLEIVKAVGGISWVIGIVMLLISPLLAMPVLIVALLATIYATSETRKRRHDELLAATTGAVGTTQHHSQTAALSTRLADLEKLKAEGVVTEQEYQAKRKQILDSF